MQYVCGIIHRAEQEDAIVVASSQCIATICLVGENIPCCLPSSGFQPEDERNTTVSQSTFHS